MRRVGVLGLLGVFGIIIHLFTGILPVLIPLAAMGFASIMLVAFIIHLKKKKYKVLPLLVIVFTLSLIAAHYSFNH